MRPSYPVSNLDYDLPPELIAQHPTPERSGSRLLHVDVQAGKYEDCQFTDLTELLPEHTLIYLNDSKVIPARVQGRRASGGAVELLYLENEGAGVVRAIIGSNAKLGAGELVHLPEGWIAELLEPKVLDGLKVQLRKDDGSAPSENDVIHWLQRSGEVPLPPYIHVRHADDRERYQTVYAAQAGSVAAPTAGLHFDAEMLARLKAEGHSLRHLTLHVGTGTFAPLRVGDLKDHVMHEEPYSVAPDVAREYLTAEQPVMAVGTTSLRILHTLLGRAGALAGEGPITSAISGSTDGSEALAQDESTGSSDLTGEAPALPVSGRTSAFIYPGHGTDAARLLLTNFHLPRSTLLALVYAFGGEELMRNVYAHAVCERYRFFSYGDCMLIDRGPA